MKFTTKDGNGLYLSPVATSGYRGVTILFSGQHADEYIPYVNVPQDMQKIKINNENVSGGLLSYPNVQPLWHGTDHKLTYKDVRAAAYVAQQFELNLRDNLTRFFNGDYSDVVMPPDEWIAEIDPLSIKKVAKARNDYQNKKVSRISYDAQSAMLAVYKRNPDNYKKITKIETPLIRKAILDFGPTTNKEFLSAAEEALSEYLK